MSAPLHHTKPPLGPSVRQRSTGFSAAFILVAAFRTGFGRVSKRDDGLTRGRRPLRLSHGRPDDVGAVNALPMAALLGFVEPFSSQVPQQAPVTHRLLQVPAHTKFPFYRIRLEKKDFLSS